MAVTLVDTYSTLGEALEGSYRRFAQRPALSWQGARITYGDFEDAAFRLSAAYRCMGVAKGDRILCPMPNRPELLISAAAAWKLGAIHVGADKDLTPVEIGSLVEWIRPAVVLASTQTAASLASFPDPSYAHGVPATVVVNDGDVAGKVTGKRCYAWRDLIAASASEPRRPPTPLSPDDPAVILLTSGTTGRPKGVIRHHGQLLAHWSKTAALLEASPTDSHLGQLPLTHGFGFGLAVAALLTGGRLLLVDRFAAEDILELIRVERISVLNGTPTHFARLLDSFDPRRHDLSSLRSGAGSAARFPVPLLTRIFEHLGLRFVHTYGCSEGLGWKTVDMEEMLRGSAGKPPADHIRIVGPDRRRLPAGQVGEIVVRKTHRVEYWRQPEPAESDADWHHMGDLGMIDENGLLFVFGRVKYQINRGGLRIDPGEVESALSGHPDLLDIGVVGIPDPTLGEVVCACIVPRPGVTFGLEDIRQYLSPTLARHKLPEQLRIIERVPRTRIGKVDRDVLQSLTASSSHR